MAEPSFPVVVVRQGIQSLVLLLRCAVRAAAPLPLLRAAALLRLPRVVRAAPPLLLRELQDAGAHLMFSPMRWAARFEDA